MNRATAGKPRGWGGIARFRGGFRARIYVAGQRLQKLFPTAALAQAWLKTMRLRKVAIESGADTVPGLAEGVRFRDLEAGFEARIGDGFHRLPTSRTADSYLSETRALLEHWGNRRVAATTERDVADYVHELRAEGYSTSTIRHRLDRLSQLVRFAVERQYIAREPCRIRRPATVGRSRPALVVTEEQLERMVAGADPLGRAVILLAADAGLRRDEIRRFTPADLEEDRILVWFGSERDRTKSGRFRRVPILTPRLGRALKLIPWGLWPRSAWSVATAATPAWNLVLPGRARLHAFRHRFVTALLAAGVPLAVVQLWVGHATPLTTLGYSHLDPMNVPGAAYTALTGSRRVTRVPRGTRRSASKALQ